MQAASFVQQRTALAARSLMVLALSLSAVAASAQVAFENRADQLPVQHSYEGEWHHYVGGGVAVMDCNGDQMPDIYAAGGAARSHLFINTSTAHGEVQFREGVMPIFTDVTGAYPLDVDGDGILDLAILRLGPNVLMRGLGECRFEPAPADWGFEGGDE